MSPEVIMSIAGGVTAVAGGVTTALVRRRSRHREPKAAVSVATGAADVKRLAERVAALEQALSVAMGRIAHAEGKLESVDRLDDRIYELARAAGRVEAGLEAGHRLGDSLDALLERTLAALDAARSLPPVGADVGGR